MSLTATDLFCGAGGSALGITAAGVDLRLAANHWQLAIDSHQHNFPAADHDCADISQVDPRRYPRTDLLWASPECTNHSQAKGIRRNTQLILGDDTLPDEAAVRSRATMWDVIRFAEHHRYTAIVVENVVDAANWELYGAWRSALQALGYQVRVVYLNSMHAWGGRLAAAPQSRDRMYVVATRPGIDVDLEMRPQAWCPECEKRGPAKQTFKRPERPWGRYRAQYAYRCRTCRGLVEPDVLPAATAIDWALRGQLIGERTRPLKPATVRRIEAGLRKYARPMVASVGGNTFERGDYVQAWPTDQPFVTRHTTSSDALIVPVEGRAGVDTARSVGEPTATLTGRLEDALAVLPFIAELRGGGSEARPVSNPLATVTAAGNHHGLICPPLIHRHNTGGAEMLTPASEPTRTVTTKGHQSLLVPYYGNGTARPVSLPVGTVTTRDRQALVELPADLSPFVDGCEFRMLTPSEIGAAMAFHSTYTVLGNNRERVRQYGNAVTPPASALLMERLVEALSGAA